MTSGASAAPPRLLAADPEPPRRAHRHSKQVAFRAGETAWLLCGKLLQPQAVRGPGGGAPGRLLGTQSCRCSCSCLWSTESHPEQRAGQAPRGTGSPLGTLLPWAVGWEVYRPGQPLDPQAQSQPHPGLCWLSQREVT